MRYWPLAEGTFTITSGFGARRNPVTGEQEGHLGLDFAAAKGAPFYAPADGICIEGSDRTNVSGFGRWVWLDCQKSAGVDVIIGHGDPAVRGGQLVKAGQLIGYVNSHGQSTGPHAHVEIWSPPGRVGGRALDPAPWFAGARYPTADTPKPKVVVVDNPITRTDLSPNCHSGGRNVTWVTIHTQEGRGKARNIIPYLKNPAPDNDPAKAVSYNAVVDDVESVLVVPWDMNSWSASNANPRADHILMAGTFAGWSRGKWLERDASDGVDEDEMLTRTAALVAWRCQVRNIPIEYVGGHGMPSRPGVCGHVDFGQWGGGHTDPGPHFPWDELIKRARGFAEGDDMPSAEEVAHAVWAHRLTKPNGRDTETAGNMLAWDDQHVGHTLDQLAGPGAKDQRGDLHPEGWKQLGGKTVVDSLADAHRKIDKLIELVERRNT